MTNLYASADGVSSTLLQSSLKQPVLLFFIALRSLRLKRSWGVVNSVDCSPFWYWRLALWHSILKVSMFSFHQYADFLYIPCFFLHIAALQALLACFTRIFFICSVVWNLIRGFSFSTSGLNPFWGALIFGDPRCRQFPVESEVHVAAYIVRWYIYCHVNFQFKLCLPKLVLCCFAVI